MVAMAAKGLLGFPFFGTFMRNKILGIVPKFQGKMSFCSKVMNLCGIPNRFKEKNSTSLQISSFSPSLKSKLNSSPHSNFFFFYFMVIFSILLLWYLYIAFQSF